VGFNHNAEGPYEAQLIIRDVTLPPGEEWVPRFTGWLVIHVSRGVGYWMTGTKMNCELLTGTVLSLSNHAQGLVRASQVGELGLQYFHVEPKRLTGLATIADQRVLKSAAEDDKQSLRLAPANTRLSDIFKKLSSKENAKTLPARAQLLLLFLEVFRGDFQHAAIDEAEVVDAKERLRLVLNQTLVDDVSELDFSELVRKTGCSPRHVSRLFTELMGVSFREKQTEIRLARACELLATTNSKVAAVAMESGYQSTSFFNLMFKQRFGVNPTKWRQQAKRDKTPKRAVRRLQLS
jgi:AraC-like DNA-binding protein